ncbi:DnaJ family domain-containing protein [Rosenbergiella australiborealis]|uniref:DUF1992 domain-containing protein n=1 Tax=Rosenbergiella australiborealis TaxID=1544696 RepID=A0ABS5T4G5_9GAMM|nr:DnaJ family domain-containing protein [Rosenbergiella australiborealis]MBT0727255.1 DUF1992 domain-containing protein [Rosenbergiella australiborealis]
MLFLEALVERSIKEAIEQGQFDNLPGAGRPLLLDDDSLVPENLRMSYRIMKMSGYLPEELQLRQDALNLQTLIIHATNTEERNGYHAELTLVKTKLVHAGFTIDFLDKSDYADAVKERLLKRNCK